MRVAFVVHGPCPPAFEELALALARARHAVRLFGDAEFEGFGRRFDGLDRVHVTAGMRGSVSVVEHARAGLAAAETLARHLDEPLGDWQPDVVHAIGLTAGIAAHRAARPTVPVVQSVPRLAATQRRLGSISTTLAARMLLERRVLDRAAMIVADSSGQAMEMLRAGVRPARIVTLTPAVDWHRYPVTPLPRRSAQRPWCLLHPGGSSPDSGVEDAMAAISALPNAHLTIAGAHDDDAEVLRAAMRRWRVHDRTIVHGRVAASAMPSMYVAADAVIVPPRQLSSGRLVLEALSSGRPVIASSCGGIVDIVEDGVTGFLAPPRDPAALAAAVRRAMTASRGVLEEMALQGVMRVRQEHAWQQRLPSLLAIYEALVGVDRRHGTPASALASA